MTQEITSGSALREKIEAKRYDYFTFPILDITIKYRKPDLLKLSLNKSLPQAMADAVITAYKEAVGGADMAGYVKDAANKKLEADDSLIKDMDEKGYLLLQQLCVSHSILNVDESDFDTVPIPLIAWHDIPEEDAIAFLLSLIQRAQTGKTESGGEISAEEITDFPDGERSAKRSTPRTNGKAVRANA
jgi:hypothetical protein